jgi:hypothetical protein
MPTEKALGVQVVTVCREAEVVVKMLEYVLAYVEVSVTTDSCTAAAGVAAQAEAEAVGEVTSGKSSVEDEEEVVVELVTVDSNTVMI